MQDLHKQPIKDFFLGSIQATPLALSYFSFAIPFGILAVKLHIPPLLIILMSGFVYACSSQCLALSLMATLAHPLTIFIAVFLVNFRHFFMSMSLGAALPRSSFHSLFFIAWGNTDETYALNMIKYQSKAHFNSYNVLGTNITAHIIFIMGTMLGIFIGESFQVDLRYIIGALPVMFASLIALQIQKRMDIYLIALSIALTLALNPILPGKLPFLLTILLTPTIALLFNWKKEKKLSQT